MILIENITNYFRSMFEKFSDRYPTRNSSGASIPFLIKLFILFQIILIITISIVLFNRIDFTFKITWNIIIYLLIAVSLSVYYQSIAYQADQDVLVQDVSEFIILTSIVLFENISITWTTISLYMLSHFIFGMRSPYQFVFNTANSILSGTIALFLYLETTSIFSISTPFTLLLFTIALFLCYYVLDSIQTIFVVSRVINHSFVSVIKQLYDLSDQIFLLIVTTSTLIFIITMPELYYVMFALIFLMYYQQISRHKEIKSRHVAQEELQVSEHKRELEQMRVEKLGSLQSFAGKVAHDINNYLSIMYAYLEIIEEKFEIEEKNEFNALHTGLDNTSELIKELSNFANQENLNLEEVEINQFVANISRFVLSDRRIHHEIVMYHSNLYATIDKTKISQTLSNIIINAIEAIEEVNKGRITIEIDKRKIPDTGEYAIIKISDTGLGIPEEFKDKIFLPYFTTKQQGTGLGIATAHAIITAHNGQLKFNTRLGEGTTFIIEFPLID